MPDARRDQPKPPADATAKPAAAEPSIDDLPIEEVPIERLKPHPRNYRKHPEDQIAHLVQSLREHGVYRNVVVAEDYTILAGHGVVEALGRLGRKHVRVARVSIAPDDPKALKILTGDNELGLRAEIDDRALTEMLREIAEVDVDGLLGTGYDTSMLAALAFVTRDASEIQTTDAAAHWAGMPGYDETGLGNDPRLVVTFGTAEQRDEFMRLIGVETIHKKTVGTWSIHWPPAEKEDLSSVRYEPDGE